MTHGLIASSTISSNSATVSQIGDNIILPANGDWIIHHVFGMMVMPLNIADQGAGGFFQVQSVEGAIEPDPAPGRFPFLGLSSPNSVLGSGHPVPLQLFWVDWNAAGKATLRFNGNMDVTTTGNPVCMAGILFGKEHPTPQPMRFATSVDGPIVDVGEQFIGEIVLSERATKITHIYPDFIPNVGLSGNAPTMCSIRLDSDDIDITPAEFPCLRGYLNATVANAGASAIPKLEYINVDIPVVNGARINVFATLQPANPSDGQVSVYIGYQ